MVTPPVLVLIVRPPLRYGGADGLPPDSALRMIAYMKSPRS